MEVVEIYKDWLYSITFDEEDLTEYHRVFREWHDLDYLVRFFSEHKDFVNTDFGQKQVLILKTQNYLLNE